jgi:hypothetical protein
MTNHEAPGADGLPPELLKYCGPSGLQILLLLFNMVHDRECIPQGWREGALVSAPKTGELTNCTNYRRLTLLSAISKLFSKLLLQRMSPHVELNDHQYGFRHERGTAHGLFALDAIVRPRVQRGEITYLLFLDWSKAYDRLIHHAFLARLAHKGVTGKLWRPGYFIPTGSQHFSSDFPKLPMASEAS